MYYSLKYMDCFTSRILQNRGEGHHTAYTRGTCCSLEINFQNGFYAWHWVTCLLVRGKSKLKLSLNRMDVTASPYMYHDLGHAQAMVSACCGVHHSALSIRLSIELIISETVKPILFKFYVWIARVNIPRCVSVSSACL